MSEQLASCPSCGTKFKASEAPWTQQKIHCPIHDRVRMPDSTCEFCDADAASAKSANSAPVMSLEDAIKQARDGA